MDYEQTVAALMEFIGRPVYVLIAFGELPDMRALATMRGTLERATVNEAYQQHFDAEGETLFFKVGDDGFFTVSSRDLASSEWAEGDRSSLRMRFGPCETQVFLDPEVA